ncbi:putative nucleic acid-binding protein [Bradyrhizobium sp. GM24.11]
MDACSASTTPVRSMGRISAIRSVPVIDSLLAATALTHDLTLVTRNDRDVAGLGARVRNPFRGGRDDD